MKIIPAEKSDLGEILGIYAKAREFMKRSGNPTQWGDSRPALATTERDIAEGRLYKIVDGGRTVGVFAFIIGEDPTYRKIDGKWPNDELYGTIHRIASDGTRRGIFDAALKFCFEKCRNIRIDTHEKNLPMRRCIERAGFKYCGKIITDDGTERMAFEGERECRERKAAKYPG